MRSTRTPTRALTVVEVLIAAVVMAVGILVILSTFSLNLRQSTQTREHLLANLVMESLIEEVLAHPYGQPAPESWKSGEVGFQFIVEGREQQVSFTQSVETAKGSGNGAFFGGAKADTPVDVVTLTVTWTEATGRGSSAADESLSLDLTVRRNP